MTDQTIPSLAYGVPPGAILGNLSPGNGPAQPIALTDLAHALAGTGVLSPPGSPATLGNSGVVAGSYTNTNLTVNAQGLITAASNGAGGGGGSGLWAPAMSAVPTSASTGLTTWGNQGSASVADTAVGVSITKPGTANSDDWSIRYKTAPATPYTITALVSLTSIGSGVVRGVGIGWFDGTKAQVIRVIFNGATTTPALYVSNETNLTTVLSNVAGAYTIGSALTWLQISDDGTTVYFRQSLDGVNFATAYSVSKSSGFLGASGYSNVFFGTEAKTETAYGTLMSWAQT